MNALILMAAACMPGQIAIESLKIDDAPTVGLVQTLPQTSKDSTPTPAPVPPAVNQPQSFVVDHHESVYCPTACATATTCCPQRSLATRLSDGFASICASVRSVCGVGGCTTCNQGCATCNQGCATPTLGCTTCAQGCSTPGCTVCNIAGGTSSQGCATCNQGATVFNQSGATIFNQTGTIVDLQQAGQTPVIYQVHAQDAPVPQGVSKRYVEIVGHEADYSWITGQLFYVHADGGLWILRYAGVGTEDRFGGSVVLAPSVNMKNFREGDLISVRGQIVSEERASRWVGAPLYQPVSVDMVQRAD